MDLPIRARWCAWSDKSSSEVRSSGVRSRLGKRQVMKLSELSGVYAYEGAGGARNRACAKMNSAALGSLRENEIQILRTVIRI